MVWNIGDKVSDKFEEPSFIWRFSLLDGVVRYKIHVVTKTTPKKIFLAEVRQENSDLIIYNSEFSINKDKLNSISEGICYNQMVIFSDSENEGRSLLKLAAMKEVLRLERVIEDTQGTLSKTRALLEGLQKEVRNDHSA